MLNDITLILVVDARHLNELKYTWPTWMKFKPELVDIKKIVVYDKTQLTLDKLTIFNGYDVRLIPWNIEGVDQREKMLTAFVKVPATEVDTKWYLKLDADTIATGPGKLLDEQWFKNDPVYIGQRWTFSKPADVLYRLDNWGDMIPELAKFKRLDIPFDPKASRVRSRRITSWCFFGRTDWTRKIWGLCNGRLPVPSQDTLMYYCAARTGEHTMRVDLKSHGWEHLRLRGLKLKHKEVMG